MGIETLVIQDFRNYAQAAVEFPRRVTALVGRNAQGKTNLLEALYLAATLQSFRSSRAEDLVRTGAEGFFMRAVLGSPAGSRVATVQGGAGRLAAALDGRRLRGAGELRSLVPAVVFSPEDLILAGSGSEPRRRYLDRLAALTQRASHADDLRRARRITEQRNRLLRARPADALEAWDQQLAVTYARIAGRRQQAAVAVAARLPGAYEGLGGPGAAGCAYRPAFGAELETDLTAAQEQILKALAERRSEEVRAGVSLIVPQRDEVVLDLDRRPVPHQASRGEARLLALALRAVELELTRAATGEPPLLLLDDVLSELDGIRVGRVLDFIRGGDQVVLTALETAALGELGAGATVYRVEDGRVGPGGGR
ncbi:MAG: DNA replication/repair protein RecF [Candidatus Methylomirabilales bacterium]